MYSDVTRCVKLLLSFVHTAGDIKYWEHVDELLNIDRILKESMYINNDSVVFWFSEFHKQFCVPPEEDYDWGDDDGFAALIEVAETDCTDGK